MKKLIYLAVVVLLLATFQQIVKGRFNRGVIAGAPADCQYPQRPLVNGGCDNTDPCDPETLNVPGLWGACRPEKKANVNSMSTPGLPYVNFQGNTGAGK